MDAIVLAGGHGARLGGRDKASLVLEGRTFLELVTDALGSAGRIVVVGPRRALTRQVVWTRESPPGGGPLAALDAGLRLVTSETVALAAVDLPHLRARHIAALAVASAGRDGAIFVDTDGRDQPLAGVYSASALRRALAGVPSIAGAAFRGAVEALDLARLPGAEAVRDCDTPSDLAAMGVERGR